MSLMTVSKVLDNTTVHCELTLTLSQRTANSVRVNYTFETYLNSGGRTDAGYEQYYAVLGISGANITTSSNTVVLKEKSEGWSGSTHHTVTGHFDLTLSSSAALSMEVSLTTKSTADSVNYGYGTASLSIGAYTPPVPGNPSYVTLSEFGYGDTLSLTFGTVSGASGYRVYYSVNGGAYALKATVYSGSYTDSSHNLKPGDTLSVIVSAYSSGGESSGRASSTVTVSGGMRLKVNSVWKRGVPYVKVGSTWKKAKAVYVNVGGSWRKSK